MTPAARKEAFRRAAIARRQAARAMAGPGEADRLIAVIDNHRGRPLAGYAAMRSEIDPAPALAHAAGYARVGLPVVEGPGRALGFRQWRPGAPLVAGAFGARVPDRGAWMIPDILIVPLVAFDRRGGRLGYGGGFYDRTLEALRASHEILAIGFAFAAQEMPDLPLEPTDQPLDLVVTETEIIATR